MSLARAATAVFDADELELFLTLTASDDDREATAIVRFVSSARGFNGAGLRRAFSSDLESGDEVFGASEAGLTIWHSANESESYALEGADAGLFGASDAGAVTGAREFVGDIGGSLRIDIGFTRRRGGVGAGIWRWS